MPSSQYTQQGQQSFSLRIEIIALRLGTQIPLER
jgi:hypothetical protein